MLYVGRAYADYSLLANSYINITSLAWPDRFFPFFFVVAEKSGLATRD